MSTHGQRHRLAGVENHDGVGIDGGDFFDEFVLIAGKAKDRLEARPEKDYGNFCVLCGGDRVIVICLALLRGVPAEADLNRGIGRVGAGVDFDGVGAGGEFDGTANIIEAVGGGDGVVLIGLEDVAVNTALECASGGEAFAVERDAGVGAESLQVDPISAGVGRSERAFPRDDGVGRKCVAAFDGEVDLRVSLRGCADGIR